jgi:general secretion pathway protein I
VATLLARSKLVDLEQKLNQDGFSDFDKEIDGTFEAEKRPEIKWKAEILKPDLTKSLDQFTGIISSALGGIGGAGAAGGTGGLGGGGGANPLAALLGSSSLVPPGTQLPDSLSGSASSAASAPTTTGLSGMMGGAMTGIIQSQAQALVQQLQQGIREIRLTVTWPDGNKEDSFMVTTHLIVLNPTGTGISTGTTPLPPGQGSSNGSGAGGLGGLGGLGMPGLGGPGSPAGAASAVQGTIAAPPVLH